MVVTVVGKSELIEMIGFAFFGTVSLRGKASTYSKLYVELQFNYNGEKFLIKRKVSDATLSIYDENTKQYVSISTSTSGVNSKIISLFGYDYNIYVLSNYCPQGKLQYFSELTPAKRLQFIDKVSGIEDAKELVAYLNEKRKELNNKINLVKDLITEPTINPSIDLELDYDHLILEIDTKENSLNQLYKELDELRSSILPIPKRPYDLSNDCFTLASFTEEDIEEFVNILDEYKLIEKQIDSFGSRKEFLRGLIIPSLYDNGIVSAETIKAYLNQAMINSLNSITISCPSCTNNFSIDSLKNHEHNYPVRHLSNYLEFIEKYLQEYENILHELPIAIEARKSLVERFKRYPSQIDICYPYVVHNAVREARDAIKSYEEVINEISTSLAHNASINMQISSIQDQISSILLDQKSNKDLRDLYTTYKIERDIYKKELSLYLDALEKYNEFKIEYDLCISLIKECNIITEKIKLETIPLINHYASTYLNTMTKGVMSSIKVTDTYDLLVDNVSINLRSGAQKDLSSLAFRLSLGQSIILGMLPLFIGDEIDQAAGEGLTHDISEALDKIAENYQVILITHKSPENFENYNIINLG